MDRGQQPPDIVGREEQLGVLRAAFADSATPGALLLTGGPGIGKTTLWEAGVEVARASGLRVLRARPGSAEAEFSYAALGDLLEGVGSEELAGMPAPQLRALDVTLLRAEPTGAPIELRAVAMGVLSTLRRLGAKGPVLVAIDDVQWLDPASAEALTFAARRLGDEPIGFLMSARSTEGSDFVMALERRRLRRLEVGPLSLGAIRRILLDRLGLTLPRRVARLVVEASEGNPLFALELGRTLIGRGMPAIGDDLRAPARIEELLGARIEELPPSLRTLLLALALDPRLDRSQLEAIVGSSVLTEALGAGLLVMDEERMRPAHPLIATAVRERAPASERGALHRKLAGLAADQETRARHLARATDRPDPDLAQTVSEAAVTARERCAAGDAVELAEHALRLTPPDSVHRPERLVALGEYLLVAGDAERVTQVLAPVVEELPRGAVRGRAHLLLADGAGISTADDVMHHLELALAECDTDAALRAAVVGRIAEIAAFASLDGLSRVEAEAEDALSRAPEAGADVERLLLLCGLAWVRILHGEPVDDLRARSPSIEDAPLQVADSLERVDAVRLIWRGRVGEATERVTRLTELADERGEALSSLVMRMNLCELDLRAGRCQAAGQVLEEWAASSDRSLLFAPHYERCRALLAAIRGVPDEAEKWAGRTIAAAEATGVRWDTLEARRAQGIAALLAGNPAEAAASLRAVWEHTESAGIDDRGAFPVGPDLVEALTELGEDGEARLVADRLRELAARQEHPWGLASAARCEGLAEVASRGDADDAEAGLTEAVDAYTRLDLRFDAARSLLSLGRAQRRRKGWGAARTSLERAASGFERMGAVGWAERARSELSHVGGRRPRPSGELTPAELHTAELAAEGLSNKEIAARLVVSVRTVESHLSSAYTKLGLRSRTQLARHVHPRA